MSKVIDVIERDGRKVQVYESGLERDAESGRILKPAAGTLITRESSTVLHRRRQEKTAALLRARIAETHSASMPNPTTTAAAAFAESGAMLYEQVVLNSEAYPRDRVEAWQTLGKYSRVLPADVRQAEAEPDDAARLTAAAAAMNAEAARILARVFADVKKVQTSQPAVVEGTFTE